MPYNTHFRLVDDVSLHFDTTVAGVDPFLRSRYVGFYAVASAAVVELAVKDIFVDFATSHGKLFGDYCRAKYERINGKVGFDDLCKDHLRPFGQSYVKRFKRIVRMADYHFLKVHNYSVKKSYETLFVCRHSFAHEGIVPEQISFDDVKRGYSSGKVMLACLDRALS
jgi:hypothetical protein